MEPLITWAIILFIIAAVFFLIELFVPSGGLLGLVSLLALIGTVVCIFMVDVGAGAAALVIAVVLVPIAVVVGLKVFPSTPIGRRLILSQAQGTRATTEDQVMDTGAESMIGQVGKAVSELRPVGTCQFGEQRMDCLAEDTTIDAGTQVRIVEVNGMEVRVRPA